MVVGPVVEGFSKVGIFMEFKTREKNEFLCSVCKGFVITQSCLIKRQTLKQKQRVSGGATGGAADDGRGQHQQRAACLHRGEDNHGGRCGQGGSKRICMFLEF